MKDMRRMDWECIAYMLGDMHDLYRTSRPYAERHTYNEQQRSLMVALNECLEKCKVEAEQEIATLLMVGETDE